MLMMMVKLQQSFSYIYTAKEGKKIQHHKYTLNIPDKAVNKLGWMKGEELEIEVDDKILKVRQKRGILRKQVSNK